MPTVDPTHHRRPATGIPAVATVKDLVLVDSAIGTAIAPMVTPTTAMEAEGAINGMIH